MTVNTGLILVIIVMLLVNRWREQDVLEQIRAERNDVRRDEQGRCRMQLDSTFLLYKKAIEEGFKIADEANNRIKKE
jgi:hypothetical protein